MVAGIGGTSKQVHMTLLEYQKARAHFVESIGTLLGKNDPMVLRSFLEADLVSLLTQPLIQDVIPSVQINSLNVVATIVSYTDAEDEALIIPKELEKVKTALTHPHKAVQQAGCNAFTAIACKSLRNADAVLSAEVLPALQLQMAEVEPGPKEATVRLLNTLVVSGQEVCNNIMTLSAVREMVANLQLAEAPDGLKTVICSTLADTATYSQTLAARVVEARALPLVAAMLRSPKSSTKLRAASLLCLGQVAKHSAELAQSVVDEGVAMPMLNALLDASPAVRCNASLLVHECARKTQSLCESVVADGGVPCLRKHLETESGHVNALPTILTVGNMADFSVSLAIQAVTTRAAQAVIHYLDQALEDKTRIAAAWTLSRIARHGKETAQPIAEAGVLPELLKMYMEGSTEVMRIKAKEALKEVVHNCHDLLVLEHLVSARTPPEILRHVLHEFEVGLPDSIPSKRSFITSGALMRMLCIESELRKEQIEFEARSKASAEKISSYFPADVVKYYSLN